MRIRTLRWSRFLLALNIPVSILFAASDLRLIEAVKNKERAGARTFIQVHVDVNARHGDGATALHWAAHWDDLETADLLIGSGSDVNAADDLGVAPLSLACENASGAMVRKLLAAGANAN